MTICLACSSDTFQQKVYDHHHFNSSNNVALSEHAIKNLVPDHFIFKGLVNVCDQCGHGVLLMIPSDEQITDFYNTAFWGREDLPKRVKLASTGCFSNVHLARAKHQKQFISQYVDLNNLKSCLEIGAGDALLSKALKRYSNPTANFFICEPGEHWNDYYRNEGLKKIADFFPFSCSREPYELIVTSHWLEHIPDVRGTLTSLNSKLKAGGKLFIEVPNTGYDYWHVNVKDTPHIHFFTKHSLARLAENAGFKVIEIAEFGIPIAEHVTGKKPNFEELSQKPRGYALSAILEKD
ncbi:Methyltransferase type 12 [Glaciecola sp. 4H-3-7+YE-5]|nr:Methyltransferase type 12 [Glaciecola sp. 4H-3-7+YE-5]